MPIRSNILEWPNEPDCMRWKYHKTKPERKRWHDRETDRQIEKRLEKQEAQREKKGVNFLKWLVSYLNTNAMHLPQADTSRPHSAPMPKNILSQTVLWLVLWRCWGERSRANSTLPVHISSPQKHQPYMTFPLGTWDLSMVTEQWCVIWWHYCNNHDWKNTETLLSDVNFLNYNSKLSNNNSIIQQ